MTTRELSSALGLLGYDVPLIILTTWRRKRVQQIYKWVLYRQNSITPVGPPRKFPIELAPFKGRNRGYRMQISAVAGEANGGASGLAEVRAGSAGGRCDVWPERRYNRGICRENEPDYDLVAWEREVDLHELIKEARRPIPAGLEPREPEPEPATNLAEKVLLNRWLRERGQE